MRGNYFTKILLALCAGLILALSAEAADLIAQEEVAKAVWIDVRSPGEFESGHLEYAINIPHTEIEARISEVTADKNADIRLYCASGHRAGGAKDALVRLGYTNVSNMGGYRDLVKEPEIPKGSE